MAYGESGPDAIWFYARQRNDRCSVHYEKVTRGVLRQGKEIVYLLAELDKAFDRVPSIGVGNEEERYARGNGESSDEFVGRCNDKSQSWTRVVRGV